MLNKIKKLKNMPREEIFFRFQEKALELYEMIQHISGRDLLDEKKWAEDICGLTYDSNFKQKLFERFVNTKTDFFFTESYEKTERCKLIKEKLEWKDWISEADDILKGNIVSLGCQMKIPSGKSWHIDPVKGKPWPEKFYKQAENTGDMKACDIKYIWEINRHQYLIILAKAYWFTGNEKYAQRVFEIIDDWIIENPYHSGVNWTSSLELAVRSISWIWALFLCKESKHLSPQIYLAFLKSVYEHAKHIENHLSYYSSPYNHLIGEAAALHIIGSLFPQLKNGKKWEQLGWNILSEQVEKQFHSDGMCVEQAIFYHHFTLGFYLQSVFLRRINNKTIPENLLSRLEKALEFSMYITKPDGTLPMIGDIDNARSLYFNSDHSWDFRGFLGLGAVLFNRPDFKHQSQNLSEEMVWLCNTKDINTFINMESKPPSVSSIALHASGYYIFRDLWKNTSHYLCFDSGKISEGIFENEIPSAAHGHADALSFQLSAFGKPFLVDSGFYTYFGDINWHKHYRCEEAHNTLKIEGFRQAQYCGRLTWKQVVNPVFEQWDSTNNYDFVSARLVYPGNISHNRKILYLKNNYWFFTDHVESDVSNVQVESYFHFDPCVELIVEKENQQLIASVGNTGILIKYFNNVKVSAYKQGNMPASGWVATGYGIRQPAWRVKLTWNSLEHNGLFPFIIIPWKNRYDSFRIHDWSWDDSENNLFKISLLKSGNDDCFTVIIKKNYEIQLVNKHVIYKS